MTKTAWKPGALLAPVPAVMVTCGAGETANSLAIGWPGSACARPPKPYISVRPERFSYPLIVEQGEFAVNLVTAELIRAADFCGVRSGREVDKFAACGLTRQDASQISCPLIAESPLALECRVDRIIPLGSHDMILADIAAVDVEDSLIDAAGRLDLGRCGLAAYAHGSYHILGKEIGHFGFSVRKKARKKTK